MFVTIWLGVQYLQQKILVDYSPQCSLDHMVPGIKHGPPTGKACTPVFCAFLPGPCIDRSFQIVDPSIVFCPSRLNEECQLTLLPQLPLNTGSSGKGHYLRRKKAIFLLTGRNFLIVYYISFLVGLER